MVPKNVQIETKLFIEICQFFKLLDQPEAADPEALENDIKFRLNQKIEKIQNRLRYEQIIKAEPGSAAYEEAVYQYLKNKN